MRNGEFITAPLGLASSILSVTVPSMDDVEAVVLLITAIVCGLRSIWIAAKPILKKIYDAIVAYRNRKNGGNEK